MALLQDQEARIKKEQEYKRKYGSKPSQIAMGFLIATIITCGALLIFVLYAVSPNSGLIRNKSTAYDDRLTNKLVGTIRQGAETTLPTDETIAALRKTLAAGDFALLTTPDVKSTKTNTTISYDLRIVRSEGFAESVRLSAANLPSAVTAIAEPELVDSETEKAAIRLTIPGNAPLGSYNFNIIAKADTKEKATNASLSVSNFVINNAKLVENRKMDAGSKWQTTIGWDTDVPANTWVEYATDAFFNEHVQAYAYTSTNQANSKEHANTLYYLEPDTIYHYRIKSVDELNNIVIGPDRAFITSVGEE